MALTALEQLELVKGSVRPDATDLRTLVKATAFIKASAFYDDYKVFDESGEAAATSYLSKMFNLSRSIIRGNSDESLFRVLVTIIGEANFTFEQVQAATDSQWEDFVSNNILKTMEIVADIRKNEKTAYDAI